jgi:hypothetical protein
MTVQFNGCEGRFYFRMPVHRLSPNAIKSNRRRKKEAGAMKTLKQLGCAGLAALLMSVSLPSWAQAADGAAAGAAGGAAGGAAVVTKAEKNPVAKLRGKLLYKKNQIRKLERSATGSNEALRARAGELEKERRGQYVAVEPKLAELYSEQDALAAEIDRLAPPKK